MNETRDEQTILVTGATGGIGEAVTELLLDLGHRVLVHGRTQEKAKTACESLGTDRAHPVFGDLSDQGEVRRLASQVEETTKNLDVIVNNAGKSFQARHLSSDGVEMTLAINVLAPFLLTGLLFPLLSRNARVVNLVGKYHKNAILDFDDIQFTKRSYGIWQVANHTQMLRVLFTFELANRLTKSGSAQMATCVHPGAVLTDAQKSLSLPLRLFIHTLARPGFVKPHRGARPIVRLAVGNIQGPLNGLYFEKHRERKSIESAYEISHQRMCWNRCVELTGAEWPGSLNA